MKDIFIYNAIICQYLLICFSYFELFTTNCLLRSILWIKFFPSRWVFSLWHFVFWESLSLKLMAKIWQYGFQVCSIFMRRNPPRSIFSLIKWLGLRIVFVKAMSVSMCYAWKKFFNNYINACPVIEFLSSELYKAG